MAIEWLALCELLIEMDQKTLAKLSIDYVFDGGELDCGSGLVLLLREAMLSVPEGGILEMRSSEPTVGDDLPPWCNMTGNNYLGKTPLGRVTRYFIQKGKLLVEDATALEADLAKAKEYEWRLRARSTGNQKTSVYCRNFSFLVGQPASFEEKDAHPSAIEYLLAALAGDLSAGFFAACSRANVELDDLEISLSGRLHNIMAHLGVEEGDPSLAAIDLKCYATSLASPETLRKLWSESLRSSPTYATLSKSVTVTCKFSVV
ncbi:MAG: OsmC family protein [bacterium]|nr:OsmC family protein [bacterium]